MCTITFCIVNTNPFYARMRMNSERRRCFVGVGRRGVNYYAELHRTRVDAVSRADVIRSACIFSINASPV